MKTNRAAATPMTFKIQGMDCAEEVAMLKRELAPHCPHLADEENLAWRPTQRLA